MIEGLLIPDYLDLLSRFGISLFRTSGLLILLPIFGSQLLPWKIRMWVALAITVVMFPMVPEITARPDGAVAWVLLGSRELAIGFFLGLTARTIFAAVELAARLVSGQSGFAMAQMVDPITGGQSMAPATFMIILASALFLSADLHHIFFGALRSSYEIVPPAISLPGFTRVDEAVNLLGLRMFNIAVQLAAPGLLISFTMDIIVALVGKAMSRVPILLVAFPAKLALGIVGMMLLATATGTAIRSIGRTIATDSATILGALAGR